MWGGWWGKPEKGGALARWMWGVPFPPESPSMNPETGRPSTTHTSKTMKVAESQNGSFNIP